MSACTSSISFCFSESSYWTKTLVSLNFRHKSVATILNFWYEQIFELLQKLLGHVDLLKMSNQNENKWNRIKNWSFEAYANLFACIDHVFSKFRKL